MQIIMVLVSRKEGTLAQWLIGPKLQDLHSSLTGPVPVL